MVKTKKLHIKLTTQETALGWLYLALELFVLPGLLTMGNAQLSRPLSEAALNFLFFFLNFAAVILIFHRFLYQSIVQAGKQFSKVLRAAVLGFLAYWFTSMVLSAIPVFRFSNVNDQAIAAMAKGNFPLVATGTVLLVPVTEETLYRGLLFQGLYNRNRAAAYIISTLVFAAIHVVGYIGAYSPEQLTLCFLHYIPAGLCLAWAYASADCIFAPILIHTVINAMGIYAVR